MIRLGIAGACGRMGQRIAALAHADGQFKITGALERDNHPCLGKDYGHILGVGDLGIKVESDSRKAIVNADVLVDFATGDDVLTHVNIAREKGVKIVIGTTGISKSCVKDIKEAAKHIPIVMDSNMSYGINTLITVLPEIVKCLGSRYDIDIIETHHRMKKDWPSGTALSLAEVLKRAANRDIKTDGAPRQGPDDRKIVLHALRGGDVVGDHTIVFAGQGERIEITHKASSRDVFAFGALMAATFTMRAQPGKVYTMLDVMGAGK